MEGKKNHKLLLYQASKRGFYIHLPILQECCISWDSNICYRILYIPYQCWLLVYNSSPRDLRWGGGLQFRGTVEGCENILKCNMWRVSPSPWGHKKASSVTSSQPAVPVGFQTRLDKHHSLTAKPNSKMPLFFFGLKIFSLTIKKRKLLFFLYTELSF